MQIHIKYRVHGITEQPLTAGSIVELDEATALELIRQGAAEELDTMLPLPDESEVQARCAELEQAFKAEREHSDTLQKEVFSLRDSLATCQKELAKVQKDAKSTKKDVSEGEKSQCTPS